MSRLKLTGDPMRNVRSVATARINEYFNRLSIARHQRSQAHAQKREIATIIAVGGELAEDHPFAAEAALRDLTLLEFARLVLSKPIETDTLELARQRHLLAIDAAVTPDEVDAIVAQASL